MRPRDWQEVFGFDDPTPGDPFVVRDVARRWGAIGSEAQYAEGKLRGLLGDDAIVTWIGQAGDQFRTRSSKLPDQLGKVADSYRLASEAMTWWAGRLETHQHAADRALVDGRSAKADLEHARSRLTSALGDVDLADRAPALTALAPTPEQVQDARDRLRAAEQARSAAQGLVDDAERRLDLARRLAMDARDARESDARETTRRIHEASEAGIPERSRWQKIKDGAKAAWDVVVTVAKVVVAVLAIVALVVGGPIAWVVFAAGLVLLADALMKYADGEGSLLDIGLALLGCIPGVKGLTSLAAIRGAFRAGGALSAAGHVLAAGRTAVVEMAGAVRSLSTGAVVMLRSLRGGDAALASLFSGGNRLLGAADLPTSGRLGELLAGYDRFGDTGDAATFLRQYVDEAGNYRWPDHVVNGFADNQSAVLQHRPGDVLDRFGDPNGRFLSPDGTPFAERAIPPGNLDPLEPDLGYHRYEVLRPFDAETGYIEPWFGQPGQGLQILLDGAHFPEANGARVNVQWLIDNHYLREVPVS